MATTKQQKEEILSTLNERFARAKSIVLTKNEGLKVSQVEKVRKDAKGQNVDYQVAKKTLITLAAKNAGIEIPESALDGAVALVFGYDDELSAPKAVAKLAKEFEKLVIIGGMTGGKLVSAAEMKALASLPGKMELLAMLLSRMNSPISKFVRTINNPVVGFAQVLRAVGEKKPADAPAPAPKAAAAPAPEAPATPAAEAAPAADAAPADAAPASDAPEIPAVA